MPTKKQQNFPVDPLTLLPGNISQEYHRRSIQGILESYNGNYDVLAELVQNAVDAVEDASIAELEAPFLIEVTIDLQQNLIAVLDTGVGMNSNQLAQSLAPNVSFKTDKSVLDKRKLKRAYRGYKGVGLTFIAYGSDDLIIHSKTPDGNLTKGRMQYGRAWAFSERPDVPLVNVDTGSSELDKHARGTFVQVKLSNKTRPKRLSSISSESTVWETILRTRTAAGQVIFDKEYAVPFQCCLKFVDTSGTVSVTEVDSSFLFPHTVTRKPPFSFLDVPAYWEKHGAHTDVAPEAKRKDGIYLFWTTEQIINEFSEELRKRFASELDEYTPSLYAFLPYQSSVYREIDKSLTGSETKNHVKPGLLLAINRQRLADSFEIMATRYENLSYNMQVLVHFENAKPDQGRKTVQDEVLELAQKAADRAVQWMAKQRSFLRPAGDAPTPGLREVEKDHQEWTFNVIQHARQNPLHLPPIAYKSTPLAEQDVVGLFHQFSALGIFPGVEIFATSQIQTYDCLIRFKCNKDTSGLLYESVDENPLGISPYVLGSSGIFETHYITVEFKNNLDGLIDEVLDPDHKKNLTHINLCVCWGSSATDFKGFTLEPITEKNIDERAYPGVTHVLRHDADGRSVQVVMLSRICALIESGALKLP